MLSFWERQSFVHYDYIVIGGGIVGLSTAVAIKEKESDASVLVLERGIFPSGASTKNAGFACFGSLTELLADIVTIGEDATLNLVEERWKGLLTLRERLGDNNIDFKGYGGYELIQRGQATCFSKIDEVNDLLYPLFNEKVYSEKSHLIHEFGFNSDKIDRLVYNGFEGQIDIGKMMKSLIRYATSLGVDIITGAEVIALNENDTTVELPVKSTVYNENICFKAPKVAVCTNAFSRTLLPNIDLKPGRGLVFVTEPLETLKFKGVFHFDEGYYYFRNLGDRVIFGGGRNLDLETETSTAFEVNQKIYADLQNKLAEIILPGQPFKIANHWTGIMAFGNTKQPIIRPHSEKIIIGVRLGGMGVAIGSRIGDRLAEILLR